MGLPLLLSETFGINSIQAYHLVYGLFMDYFVSPVRSDFAESDVSVWVYLNRQGGDRRVPGKAAEKTGL